MPVDKVELAKDLETPEYQAIVKDTLSKKDFVIQTKTEQTELLNRFKQDVIEKEIPVKIQEVHNQYDKDLATVFGENYKRNQDEKTYDALKRVGSQVMTKLNGEIASLKEQIKGGDPSGTLAKQLQEVEDKAKIAIDALKKENEGLKNSATTITKSAEVNVVFAELSKTFKNELPPLFDTTKKAILDSVLNTSVSKDGVLYMTSADGNILKDSAFKEITVKDHLAGVFKDLVDVKKVQGGTGSGGNADANKNAGDGITADTFVAPETVKTKQQLMDYMVDLGLKRGTKVYDDIYKKHSEKLPLAITNR